MTRTNRIRKVDPRRAGQALVEFVIALVAIVVIFAGLLQIGLLGAAQSASMMEARQRAGSMAMQSATLSPIPPFLQGRAPGGDGRMYSADDVGIPGEPFFLSERIIAHGHPVDLDAHIAGNPVSRMTDTPDPQVEFGLLRGYDTRDVPLFPAITHLVYSHDEITLRNEVWIPWTRGIY